MATFKICVFQHQKRSDDKFPVSIRVYWKGKSSYIGTEYYVTEKQIVKKSFTLKDIFILNELNRRIAKFEDIKSKKLGMRIEMYSAKELAEYFKNEIKSGSDRTIDFVEFSKLHIEKLRTKKRVSTAGTLKRTLNAMIDFCNGREKVQITEITSKFLQQFEDFLKTERIIKRKNQYGKIITTKKKPLSDVSLIDYMTDIRTLFNAAKDEFNDEDKGEIRISHYPFRKYKMQRRPEAKKRNLTLDQINKIRDIEPEKLPTARSIFARDIFMLSFYLVGVNFVDLYELTNYTNGRISYNRQKTMGRRQDNAFISIKIEPEAAKIIDKYRDTTGKRIFDFHNRYSTSHIFSSNVNKGLKLVAESCNIEEALTTYFARHTWATLARNKCGISKNDVDLALNHVDQGLKMADIYIEKDWSLIDKANRAVLDYLNMPPLPVNNQSEETLKSETK